MWTTYLTSTKPEVSKIILVVVVLAEVCLFSYFNSDRKITNTPVLNNPHPLPFFRYNDPWWKEVVCKKAGHWEEEAGMPLKQLLRDVIPERDNNIFLLDTACNSEPKYRVWCSVESWAQQNPNHQVWFLFTSGGLLEAELPSVLLWQYSNLHLVSADLDDLFRDTPLVPLFSSQRWAQNSWPVEQLSDMLRILVLWRWGGVYSDTDVLSIRPLTLPLNALGFENPGQLGSAFITFHAHHPFLLELMKRMEKMFNPKRWGSIGPLAISRVTESTCEMSLNELSKEAPTQCPENITLYPRQTFFPIPYPAYKKFFKPGNGKNFEKRFSETFTLHFWNKMSKKTEMKVNSNSIYEVAARKFCPFTFQIATNNSDTF